MHHDKTSRVREGNFEDFKAWVREMDARASNWDDLEADIESLAVQGENILKENKDWNGQKIPRCRVLIQFLFNI